MLQNKNKVYIYIFFALILTIAYPNFVFPETECSFWNKEESSGFSVIKDLKQGTGKIWYVDGRDGDDNTANGTSLNTAFKTIRKAIRELKPGDSIVISAGIYRERLHIKRGGTENSPILIGSLGDGEVIIDASEKIEGWTVYQKNIYYANCNFKPRAVIVDEIPLFPEFLLEKVGEGKWYYDEDNQVIYLYIPGGGDPAIHNVGVISSNQNQDGILINGADYITLYGLTVRFAGGRGISILGNYNRVEKCNVKFNGGVGINIFRYKKINTTNTMIVKNHIYHNFMRNWPRGRYKKGGWGGGSIAHKASNTHFIGNIVHKNGGEGLLVYGGEVGTKFQDNIVYDNWSVNIYIDGQSDCLVERNLIFCHESNHNDLYNNGDKNPKDGKNLRRLRAEGIMTADEKSPANFKNAKIVNNIIIGCRRGITHYAAAKDSGMKNVLIAHNTIIVPDARGVGEEYIGIRIPYNHGNNDNVVIRNNIIYASNPNTSLLDIRTDLMGEFKSIIFDHNLWYYSGNAKLFQIGPKWLDIYAFDFKGWQEKCKSKNWCSGDIYANPKFVDAKKYSSEGVRLKPDSPAIGKGVPVKDVKTDYNNRLRKLDQPDIGAIELPKNE